MSGLIDDSVSVISSEVAGMYKLAHSRTDTPSEFLCEFHSHDLWEIFVYIDGGVTYYIEDKVYELIPGDMLLIPPGKMHQAVLSQSKQVYERIVVWLDTGFLNQLTLRDQSLAESFKEYRHFNSYLVNFCGDERLFILGLLNKMTVQNETDEYHRAMISAFLFTVGKEIGAMRVDRSSHEDDLISGVIKYISRHYTEPITLDSICDVFYVSKFHLNRRFKEYTKLTIYDYVLSKRVGLARRLIRNGVTASETAERCGFGDYSTFYRVFSSKTGFTPKQFKDSISDKH